MQRGDAGERPERIVRRKPDAGRLGKRGDLLGFSNRPPVWQMSGWAMWKARALIDGANSRRPTSRSPDAIGTGERRVICARPATSSGGTGSSANMMRARLDRSDVVHRRIHRGRAAVEIDHDVDVGPDRLAQRADHARDAVDAALGDDVVGVGDADDLDRVVAGLRHALRALDDRRGRDRFRRRPSCRRGRDGCRCAGSRARLPPSSRHTGTPRCLPRMSHSAISMPLIADMPTMPMRQKPWRVMIW